MAEQSKFTDLLLPEDVKIDALNALNIDVTDATQVSGLGGSYKDAAIIAIRDVTDAIESYLDRKLIVRKWNIDIPGYKWTYNEALSIQEHFPLHWPVLQVETSGITISNDKVRLLSGSKADEVTFYAGYKRREQDSDALQAELPDLSALPDDLPGGIRRVAFRLVMYELTMAKQNTFATASVTKSTGQMNTEVTRARADVYEEELSKLHSHRRVL